MKKLICLGVVLSLMSLSTACDKASVSTPNAPNQSDVNTSTPEVKAKAFSPGDIISNEKLEFTINKVEFSYDVMPDDISGFYTHYAADSGKVYLHIDADVKNLQKQNLPCDEIATVTADYDSGFTYNGVAVVEDTSTGFTYANISSITPLETKGMRFLISCPQEVEESGKAVKVTIKIGNDEFEYQMR